MDESFTKRRAQLLDEADALAEAATFETDVDTAVSLHVEASQKYQQVVQFMNNHGDHGPLSRYATRRILEHRQLAGVRANAQEECNT